MITNWKYESFFEEQNEWISDNPDHTTDIFDYISLKIFPEDLEIMMNLFMPNTFIYNDMVFLDLYDEQANIKKYFDNKKIKCSVIEKQKYLNRIDLHHIFFHKWSDSTDETSRNVAKLIKDNWEFYLMKNYPNKKIITEIEGEVFEPRITFYQVD